MHDLNTDTEPGLTEEELGDIHAIHDIVDEIIDTGGVISNRMAAEYRTSWQIIEETARMIVEGQEKTIEQLTALIDELTEENKRLISATVPLIDKSWFCGLAGVA